MADYQYPTAEQFAAESKVVANRILAGIGSNSRCVLAGNCVIGYASSIIFPSDGGPVPVGSTMPCNTPGEAADILLQASAVRGEGVGAFPWAALISVLMPLILEWIKTK